MELGNKEQLLEKYCVDKCNALGLMCIKLTCQVGVLDRLILGRHGCGIFVELKRDGNAYISKAQEVFLKELKKRGLDARIASSKGDVDKALYELVMKERAVLEKKLRKEQENGDSL